MVRHHLGSYRCGIPPGQGGEAVAAARGDPSAGRVRATGLVRWAACSSARPAPRSSRVGSCPAALTGPDRCRPWWPSPQASTVTVWRASAGPACPSGTGHDPAPGATPVYPLGAAPDRGVGGAPVRRIAISLDRRQPCIRGVRRSRRHQLRHTERAGPALPFVQIREPRLPLLVDMPVIVRHQDRGALRLDHRHDQALCRRRAVI